jgi:fructose-1,6-bisphosphatase I
MIRHRPARETTMDGKLITLSRHIAEAQKWHPEATGVFTRLMWDLTLAGRIISREVNKAGLADVVGGAGLGAQNSSGDAVQKLDQYAQERIVRTLEADGGLCVMASEEEEDIIAIPDAYPKGKYVLVFDPLDGSSNIDANVSLGTIFGIYRRVSKESGRIGPSGQPGTREDCLQPGKNLVAAGYIVYGSSTMLVYTTGAGVNGFTLDPSLGEFILSHPSMQIPERGQIYSINEGNSFCWDKNTKRYIDYVKSVDPETKRPYTQRYVGTLVADVHRTMVKGGIFLYPNDCRDPAKAKPKLRLVYEANPIAWIVEQAGGKASTGAERILDLQPEKLHQKVPLILGSKKEVELYEAFYRGER